MCLGEGVSRRKGLSGCFNPFLYVHHYFNTTGLIECIRLESRIIVKLAKNL